MLTSDAKGFLNSFTKMGLLNIKVNANYKKEVEEASYCVDGFKIVNINHLTFDFHKLRITCSRLNKSSPEKNYSPKIDFSLFADGWRIYTPYLWLYSREALWGEIENGEGEDKALCIQATQLHKWFGSSSVYREKGWSGTLVKYPHAIEQRLKRGESFYHVGTSVHGRELMDKSSYLSIPKEELSLFDDIFYIENKSTLRRFYYGTY